ncbi:unnamed protein product, partial [Ectocarpus sp. 12 AP-2014]
WSHSWRAHSSATKCTCGAGTSASNCSYRTFLIRGIGKIVVDEQPPPPPPTPRVGRTSSGKPCHRRHRCTHPSHRGACAIRSPPPPRCPSPSRPL